MKRERITIIVEVDTDPVPGWGNDPNDYVNHLQHMLNQTIPHYNPVVTLRTTVHYPPTDDRVLPARETDRSGP